MVKVIIEYNNKGEVAGFCGQGHASYAPHGEDIVCAAISVLLQTTLLGLLEVAGVTARYEKEEGNLTCKLNPEETGNEKAQTLLQTMKLGLLQIEEDHPEYLVIREEEV
ncbi:MAG: ribosomal-processing cysteine protease Prp [Halanaerobium sp.]|nr:ribosomal-processing cysteine protease Prp [Halanaerobium sp.]